MVDQEKQNQNPEELSLEQQLDQANNTPKMTVISAKVYQKDKAEFIRNADDYGRTTAGQIAYLIRKFNRGEILSPEQQETNKQEVESLQSQIDDLQSKWESEANLHNEAVKDAEALKTKKEELEKQVKEEQKKYETLLKKYNDQTEKTGDTESKLKEKDQEIKNLKKQLKDAEKKRDEYKQKFTDKANEVKELAERLNKANTWIQGHTNDLMGHAYPGEF
jgi:chromosome segregation ATPase